MPASRAESERLVYEGEVYVRPVGRGIALEDHPDRAYLADWIETWLDRWHDGIVYQGCTERLRIVVERVASPAADV